MLHIGLMILKTAGIFLLVLLGILVFLLFVLLFSPVCYRGNIQKEEKGLAAVSVKGRARWLFGAVSLYVEYVEQKAKIKIKILGIALEDWKKLRKRFETVRKKEKSVSPPAEEDMRQTISETSKEEQEEKSGSTEERKEQTQEQKSAETIESTALDVKQKKKNAEQETKEDTPQNKFSFLKIYDKICEIFWDVFWKFFRVLFGVLEKIFSLLAWLCKLPFRLLGFYERWSERKKQWKRKIGRWKHFLKSNTFRKALWHAKSEILHVLSKIRPKKAKGTLQFGFDDPALTGEILGLLGVFFCKFPKDVRVCPNFEEEVLRCDLQVQGHFCMIVFAGTAWRLFRDQNLRKVVYCLKKKEA